MKSNVNIGFLSLSCHNAVTHTKNSPSSAILHNIKSDITVLHICKGTFPHMYTYLWAQIAVFISASFSFIFYPVTSTICHLFMSISCIWKLLCLHVVLLFSFFLISSATVHNPFHFPLFTEPNLQFHFFFILCLCNFTALPITWWPSWVSQF